MQRHPTTTIRDAWDHLQADATAGIALTRSGKPYRPATIAEYRLALRHPSVQELLGRPIADVRRWEVQQALDQAARDGAPASTRRQIATALRTIWRWGQARGHCERRNIEGIELPAVDRPARAALSPAAGHQVLGLLDDPTVRAAYGLALYTGARAQEVAAITWTDIDMDAGTIRLAVDPRARKSRAALRTVPIVDPLVPLLEAAGGRWAETDRPLIPGDRGPRERAAWFRLRANAALEGGRWANVRPHDLRHSWASWLFAAGLPLPVVRDLLGHESGSSIGGWAAGVTLDVYGHSLPGHVDHAAAVMNAWLASMPLAALPTREG